MRFGVFVVANSLTVCVGCGDDGASNAASGPSKRADLARIERSRSQACDDAVRLNSPNRLELIAAVNAAKSDHFDGELGAFSQLPDIAAKLDAAQVALDATPQPKPEPPTYEKPTYHGAWPISGLCRGRYADEGIVLQANGKYFVVKHAEPCSTQYVNGFVEDTGETVTLALGRDGRDASVVEIKDRETYNDDQRAYHTELADAQSAFQQARREFPQQLKAWKDAEAATQREHPKLVANRDSLVRQWRAALGCAGSTDVGGTTKHPDGVDQDCYGPGTICKTSRVADAEALDGFVSPIIVKAGWTCHRLRYIAGDNNGSDAISITVQPFCRSGGPGSKDVVSQLASSVRRVISGKSVARGVDLLQITDGLNVDVKIPMTLASIPATAPVENAPAVGAANAAGGPAAAPDAGVAEGCDEVSCVLDRSESPCCTKFKRASDCTESLRDPKNAICRKQYCTKHSDDPLCPEQ